MTSSRPPISPIDVCTGKKQNPKTYRHHKGTSSLLETALRSCIWNIEHFVPETFADVPWIIARIIHDTLKETDTLTPRTWSLFRKLYTHSVSQTCHINIRRPSPRLCVSAITLPLSHLSLSHLTMLWVPNAVIESSDLISLLDLRSLAVLNLQFSGRVSPLPPLPVRDKAIWSWGRAVAESRGLQRLRVLLLRGDGIHIGTLMQAARNFPALNLVNLRSPGRRLEMGETRLDAEAWETLYANKSPFDNWQTQTHASGLQPEHILLRSDLPVRSKMTSLYDYAALPALDEKPLATTRETVITVQYTQMNDSHGLTNHSSSSLRPNSEGPGWGGDHDEPSVWFLRRVGGGGGVEGMEGVEGREGRRGDGGEGGARKKRKIREGKQRDVGDMLGLLS